MPFYEYRCSVCLSQFELLRGIPQRDTSAECPDCGSGQSSRMISAPMAFSMAADGIVKAMAGSSSCGGCVAASCSGCSK
ncbi:MAG: zinc ribbon domain-containing protein [Anaerolineales bacterium]|nr:zinc ribbon domain-containing protein [Anaerolineales bacterium]